MTSDAVLQQICLCLMVYAGVWGCLYVTGLLHAGLGAYVWVHTHECVPLCAKQARPVCTSANGCMFLQTMSCSHTGEQVHGCALVSTWGSDLIQSSVVMCYLNVLCWIAFARFWSIYYISGSLSACFLLLVFLCLFKTSTTKPTKRGVKKSVPEVADECM